MSGTISLTGLGIGSGLDTGALVDALVGVERQGEQPMQTKLTNTNASIQNLSSVSSLLAKLKAASDGLDTAADVGSYKASSSSTAIVASASGLASPGKYSMTVDKLAQEQRTYSNTIGSAGTALGQSGTLTLGVGSGATQDISIAATDTIDNVMAKINSAGLRVTASSFFDGTAFRIQLRGQDTGAANALSITETGTTFGFNTTGNTVQQAQDAQIKLDGFTVKSSTNQITGAIPGVTLALTATSTDPVTVAVDSDPTALQTKLKAVVDAYNAVVTKVKALGGTSSVKPTDPILAGDSTLRSIHNRLSSALQTMASGSGSYNTLGSIGLSLDRTGLLSLDSDKLNKALSNDAAGVTKMLAGTDGGALGVMDVISSAVDLFTHADTGLIATRSTAFTTQTKSLQTRIDAEETRINRYADLLRAQFTAMDTQVAAYNSQSSYLSKLG
jgi:flagellar hook-associated protein 2